MRSSALRSVHSSKAAMSPVWARRHSSSLVLSPAPGGAGAAGAAGWFSWARYWSTACVRVVSASRISSRRFSNSAFAFLTASLTGATYQVSAIPRGKPRL